MALVSRGSAIFPSVEVIAEALEALLPNVLLQEVIGRG